MQKADTNTTKSKVAKHVKKKASNDKVSENTTIARITKIAKVAKCATVVNIPKKNAKHALVAHIA